MTSLITVALIAKIRQIVRCFETGNPVKADYGSITILPDGPTNGAEGRIKQITYGESQTTEFGNLQALLKMYVDAKGKYSQQISKYVSRIGRQPSLYTDKSFLQLLKDAGGDPVMQTTQERFFNIYYFQPARAWFDINGFTLPLSLLVIYDSFVQSGSVLDFLRNEFAEVPPARGGDEKAWIKKYVDARDTWLEKNKRRELRNSDYRTDSFILAFRKDNWLLEKPFAVVNYVDNDEKGVPVFRSQVA